MCTTYKRKEKEEEGNKENPWINSGVVRSIDINMCKIIKDTVRQGGIQRFLDILCVRFYMMQREIGSATDSESYVNWFVVCKITKDKMRQRGIRRSADMLCAKFYTLNSVTDSNTDVEMMFFVQYLTLQALRQ